MKSGSYKTRPFAVLVVGLALVTARAEAASGGQVIHGLPIPAGSVEVGENRYRSGTGYEETLKFYSQLFKGLPRKSVVNQPGIKAVHWDSIDPQSGWEGFNVYEKGGETRIFILPRAGAEKGEKSKPEKSSRKKKKEREKDQQ